MNDNLIKLMALQENLNNMCEEIIRRKIPINRVYEIIKHSNIYCKELIDLLIAKYYVVNIHNNDYGIKQLINFIEDYHSNKEYLHNYFDINNRISNEIISEYLYSYAINTDTNKMFDNLNYKEKQIALDLSPIFNFTAFYYLTLKARYTLVKIACDNLKEMGNIKVTKNKFYTNNVFALSRILVSDAYTFMNLNNINGKFSSDIKRIEKNADNFNKLWKELQNIPNCLPNFLIYSFNLFILNYPYSEMYKEAQKLNSNSFNTVKKMNPFYILDEIEDFNIKKHRK